jgi:hypothetical protein
MGASACVAFSAGRVLALTGLWFWKATYASSMAS